MFTPSREEVRSFFIDTWKKHENKQPLSGLETIVLPILHQHPEYHYLLTLDAIDKDYLFSEQDNPFLHLSLHLTVAEQLAIDQPKGIRDFYLRLRQQSNTAHMAEHYLMDSLSEMLWEANRTSTTPNANFYFASLKKRLI